MIRISNLAKSYIDGGNTVDVLQDISLNIEAGETMALMGPSGSGKSTLLNILAGTIVCDIGVIDYSFAGQKVMWHSLNAKARTQFRRQHIGYVHQFFNLIPTLTVLENVRLPGRLNKRRDLDQRAADLLEQFGLAHRLDAFPEVLSGGEQQRVAVARALVLRPAFVLADEPTGNLDSKNSQHVIDLLYRCAAENDTALIVATHSDAIAQRADQQFLLGDASGE